MAFDIYGAPSFGLKDCKVAGWTSAGVYTSTGVDVPSVQMLSTMLHTVTAELTGDDTITATAARAISGEVKLRFGSVSIAVLEVLFGLTATSSIASPNRVKQFKIPGGTRFPYFGLGGIALAEEGVGDLEVFMPKCKITGDITLVHLEYGMFAIPDLTVRAVDDATFGIINVIEHEAALTVVVIPPVSIA